MLTTRSRRARHLLGGQLLRQRCRGVLLGVVVATPLFLRRVVVSVRTAPSSVPSAWIVVLPSAAALVSSVSLADPAVILAARAATLLSLLPMVVRAPRSIACGTQTTPSSSLASAWIPVASAGALVSSASAVEPAAIRAAVPASCVRAARLVALCAARAAVPASCVRAARLVALRAASAAVLA